MGDQSPQFPGARLRTNLVQADQRREGDVDKTAADGDATVNWLNGVACRRNPTVPATQNRGGSGQAGLAADLTQDQTDGPASVPLKEIFDQFGIPRGKPRFTLAGWPEVGPAQEGALVTAPVADGSSPERAFRVAAADAVDAIFPDTFVLAFAGKVGVPESWRKIPALRKFVDKGQISYLAATLTPFEIGTDGGLHFSVSPWKTTLFLSLTLPDGNTPSKNPPIIITSKPADADFELGTKIWNYRSPGGEFIFFTNERVGGTNLSLFPPSADIPVSTNWGILVSASQVRNVMKAMKSMFTSASRVAEGEEITAAAVAEPETPQSEAGALAAGVGLVALQELGRKILLDFIRDGQPLGGFASRASVTFRFLPNGDVAMLPQKGRFKGFKEGQWIVFNPKEIPDAFFKNLIPETDEDQLVKLGMTPEAAHYLALALVPHDPMRFLRQTADFLDESNPVPHNPVTPADVAKWFSGLTPDGSPSPRALPPDRLEGFLDREVSPVMPDANGLYRIFTISVSDGGPYDSGTVAQSISDMTRAAAENGWPMPTEGLLPAAAPKPEAPLPAAPPREAPMAAGPAPGKRLAVTAHGHGVQIRTGPGIGYPPAAPPLRDGDYFLADIDQTWDKPRIRGTARDGTVSGYIPRRRSKDQPYGAQDAKHGWGRYDKEREDAVNAQPPQAIAVIVGSGDTLSKIVRRFGLPDNEATMKAVAQYNRHLYNPGQLNINDPIYNNDRIYIPIELIPDRK
jgi:hypothetical protein